MYLILIFGWILYTIQIHRQVSTRQFTKEKIYCPYCHLTAVWVLTYHNLTSSEYVLYILYNVSKYTDMSTNGFHLDLQVIVIFTVDCTFSNEYMKKNYFFWPTRQSSTKTDIFWSKCQCIPLYIKLLCQKTFTKMFTYLHFQILQIYHSTYTFRKIYSIYELQSLFFVFDTCDMLFSFLAMYICVLLP